MRRAALAAAVALSAVGPAACSANKPQPNGPAVRGSLSAPRVIPGDLDARALLGDLPLRASTLGAGPVSVVMASEAVEGERLGAFVEVPADVCILAYARASSSIEDLDVAIFSDEGTPLAVDEAPDSHPTVILCPPHPERVYVAAHIASGEGLVAVGAQHVSKERAGAIGHALGARGSAGEGPRPADAWPGLEDHVRAHRAALGGKWEDVRKVALSVDPRTPTFVAFPLEADQCTDALVVPGDEVSMLEVEALDDGGRVIARAHEGGRVRALTVCSPLAVTGSLSIRPHVGRGLAAVVLSRARADVARDLSTRPDVAWVAPAQPLEAAKQARDADLRKAGYDGASSTTNGTLALGRRTSVSLDARGAAGCARVDIVAGAPLALVHASAWDDANALVAAGEGSSSVTLYACGRPTVRLDLETRGRPGPFAALLRPERWKDPLFATHPLAAGRMLARSAEGPASLQEGAPVSVTAAALDAARMHTWTAPLAAGKCLRIAVGAQGEGTGLELRAFDAATSTEIDRSHAAHAAAVRACAPADGSRSVRFELRATSGKLDAIIGQRSQ